MALTADQITAQNFKDFYGEIRPYLSGQVPTFANAFNRSDLYSTDEKIIGSWTDGKPVYQRTLTGLSVSATAGDWITLPFTIPNCDFIVDAKIYRGEFKAMLTVKTIQQTLNYGIQFIVDETRSDIHTVTLQYTKTTDQAIKVGTGNDYSTDEQIIGTWIDGKPLYQKTLDLGTNFAIEDVNEVTIGTYTTINVCVYSAFYMMDTTNNYNIYLPATSYINKSNGSLQAIALQKWAGTSYRHVYYTVQYTKTTD